MAIKFLLDRMQKEQDATMAKILEFVKKKPYPNPETRHLALFTHALFKAGLGDTMKHPEEAIKAVKGIAKKRKSGLKPLPAPPRPHARLHESALAPKQELPTPDAPMLKKAKKGGMSVIPPPKADTEEEEEKPEKLNGKEYIVSTFSTPIGIVIDVQEGKPRYKAVEPWVNRALVLGVMDSIKKDFGKNYKVLDDDAFLKKRIETMTAKLKVKPEPDMLRKVRYFLKRDMVGFKRIDVLMQDMKVKAIYVEGVNRPVLVEAEGYPGKMETNIMFHSADELNELLVRLAKATGVEITDDKPMLDTTFQEFKIQGVKGVGGASSRLTIRKVIGHG